jgi:hypothetical protein
VVTRDGIEPLTSAFSGLRSEGAVFHGDLFYQEFESRSLSILIQTLDRAFCAPVGEGSNLVGRENRPVNTDVLHSLLSLLSQREKQKSPNSRGIWAMLIL